MFATLVVVLPSMFEGGELVVYPPGATQTGLPHSWHPCKATTIEYAAFYADCEHEVLPVMSGCRVCLTYSLILSHGHVEKPPVSDADLQIPELTAALHTFFSTLTISDQNLSYCNVQRDQSVDRSKLRAPKLFTYVLEHTYTNNSLSLGRLKNKDLVVAQRLLRVCYNSTKEPIAQWYKLYVCSVKYNMTYDPTYNYKDDDVKERYVCLSEPWRHFGHGDADAALGYHSVNMCRELAPIGRFDLVIFDWHATNNTGNEGVRKVNWYKTAALIVLPLTQEYKWIIEKGPEVFCQHFEVREDKEVSEEVRHFATLAFPDQTHAWVNTSPAFRVCFDTVRKMNDVDLFVALVGSVRLFEYDSQTPLADTMNHFGWDTSFPKLLARLKKRTFDLNVRSRINVVLSLAETNAEQRIPALALVELIEALFHPEKQQNQFSLDRLSARDLATKLKIPYDTDVDLFTRFLECVYRVAPTGLAKCVLLPEVSAVDYVVPTFLAFMSTKDASHGSAIVDAAKTLKEQLTANMPDPESWAIGSRLDVPSHGCLNHDCFEIQDFFVSESQRELRFQAVGEHRDYLISFVEAHLANVMTWVIDRESRPHVLVITKRPVNAERHRVANDALKRLETVISQSTKVASEPEPRVSNVQRVNFKHDNVLEILGSREDSERPTHPIQASTARLRSREVRRRCLILQRRSAPSVGESTAETAHFVERHAVRVGAVLLVPPNAVLVALVALFDTRWIVALATPADRGVETGRDGDSQGNEEQSLEYLDGVELVGLCGGAWAVGGKMQSETEKNQRAQSSLGSQWNGRGF